MQLTGQGQVQGGGSLYNLSNSFVDSKLRLERAQRKRRKEAWMGILLSHDETISQVLLEIADIKGPRRKITAGLEVCCALPP